ncbi:MAG TPA: hypothetical protein VFG59_05600 [Anaeromyxobacter sp.]|nr:hypothetical protein [Anaeromyxobacter sp.]
MAADIARPSHGSAAARVAALANAVEARAAAHASLLDLFRAHLDVHTPGRSRSAPEHLLELVELALHRRAEAPPSRRPRAGTGPDELARLVARLAAVGRPEVVLARARAWRDFALAENVREVLSVAEEACGWFEGAARLLGPDLCAPGDALDLVRAEVLGRALRRRPPVFTRRPGLIRLPEGEAAGPAAQTAAASLPLPGPRP